MPLWAGAGLTLLVMTRAPSPDRDSGDISTALCKSILSGQCNADNGCVTRSEPQVSITTDLTEAVAGTDFVFVAIRVHGLEGRAIDERVALDEGVLGQETVGAGGISYGLRTIPVTMDIARRIAALAPDAWVINFTNPAGMVTEAMSHHLGNRVIGICDEPVGVGRRVTHALGVDPRTPARTTPA
jgi:6-phospho-beta-glucosidase